MSQRDSRQKRIGLAVVKILFEKALESIPVYGTIFVTGYKMYEAIKQEFDRGEARELTKAEILEAINSLTYAETQQEADRALNSSVGVRATKNLNSEQRAQVRRKLIQLPSEFDQLLADIVTRESSEAKEAEARREQAAAVKRQEDEGEFLRLQNELKIQLKDNQLQQAHRTVERMLSIKPNDHEAKKVEAFLYKRVADTGTGGCLVAWVLGGIISGIALIIGLSGLGAHAIFLGAFLIMLIFVFLGAKVWPSLPRGMRKLLGALFALLFIILLIMVAVIDK
jgi:hypothetical protein